MDRLSDRGSDSSYSYLKNPEILDFRGFLLSGGENAVLNRFKPVQSGKIGVKIGVKIEAEII